MLHVTSEIGHLRKVLLHEPGDEVDRMVPSMMEELLFDDILFGDAARDEHARLRRVLQFLGVELYDARDLLVRTLEQREARDWLLDVFAAEEHPALIERLRSADPPTLADALTAGVRSRDRVERLYDVDPLPNWCFQRDPQIVLSDGVVFGAMATPARHREALLARAVFRFHPQLRSSPVLCEPLEPEAGSHSLFLEVERPQLEGGDVLVLSPDVVIVGHSVRTNRPGIHRLSRALARRERGPRWLLVVELPRHRAFMHLDTLFTPVDHDACLVFAPVILPGGRRQARVWEIDLHDRDPAFVPKDDVLSALAARGLSLKPIPCGGDDPVSQQREQWTDGSNALALGPGVITLYDRNVATAGALDAEGFHVVDAEDLLLGRQEVDLDAGRRLCILLPSHELSRARGGPHCLIHPLVRDDAGG